MNVLVTGGGGFLGGQIVAQLLARGDRVAVFARGDYPHLAAQGVEVLRGDLADAGAVARACAGRDAVFHVAARAGVWGSQASFHRPNVAGTEHVLAGCRAGGVGRLIYTSSPSVVFDGRDHRGASESLPYPARYENPYSATKAQAERLVLAANGPGLATVALRPHLIVGPGDPHLLPRLVAAARAGRLVQVGNGTNRVDLTHVADAARAHLLAADALAAGRAAGRVYFLSQGEPVVLWPWIGELLRRLDVPPVRRRLPLPAARALGAVLEAAHRLLRRPGEPRLTRFLASVLARDHFYDLSAARRDLGYQPQRTMAEVTGEMIADLGASVTHR